MTHQQSKILFLVLISISLINCKGKQEKQDRATKEIYESYNSNKISIINLIGTPSLYSGKKVQVKGFLNIEFEASAIYLNENDFNKQIDKNAIWIEVSKKDLSKLSDFNKKYIILEGVFDMNNKGHESNYSGAIHTLTKLEVAK